MTAPTHVEGPRLNVVTEPLIQWRRHADGELEQGSLPELFVALGADAVRDFPALRPHQRHPWHAFLCQLAALAMHRSAQDRVFGSAEEWRAALMALTPDHLDGSAWCLVAAPDQPALMQPPVPGGTLSGWSDGLQTPDALDMLVTSKNHDLKGERAWLAEPQDWLFALLSLQTQEGFLGAGNYGISRMNGGFASRPGVGAEPGGRWGARWRRDVGLLLNERDRIATDHGFAMDDGFALLWLPAWDGLSSLAIHQLDPLYIEVCRRVRLRLNNEGRLSASSIGSKAARIAGKDLDGVTGDLWTPIEVAGPKALTITSEGFHYRLVSELLFGGKYRAADAQRLTSRDGGSSWTWVARGVVRGKGKTEGFHERRVLLIPRVRSFLVADRQAELGAIANARIDAIGAMRKLLWQSAMVLLNNGATSRESTDPAKEQASRIAKLFEQIEDQRFFVDLNAEVESNDPPSTRLSWLIGLADRAEQQLTLAFDAGPRSAMRRYRARSESLNRFRGGLRGPKSPLPALAEHYRKQRPLVETQEDTP